MTVEPDRYRAAGLARNPFSIDVHDGDAGVIDHTWFVDRGIPEPPPPGSATLVQVIGEQGAGKSTHLHVWRHRLPGPYHYVPRRPYRQRWQRPPVAPLVYGDEIDRMPVPLRRRWFRRLGRIGATVVIGTHTDLSRLGRRSRFEVRTHHLGPVDRAGLAAVLDHRVAAVTLSDAAERFAFSDSEVALILEQSGGNLREVDVIAHRIVAQRVGRLSR
jgi:hypothetical protein